MTNIEATTAEVPGEVGVAAKHVDSREEVLFNADAVFFTASTFKIPILAELYRQVDEGIIDPEHRIELADEFRAPGSGVLKELESGLCLTIHDLAMLMIIISDNTATDTLYHLVGRARLDSTMRSLGLNRTRLPMTCREMLYSMCGVEADDIALGNAKVTACLATQEIVADSPALSEDQGNVSSPMDLIQLLEVIYNGKIHSPRSREAIMDILSRQQGNSIIPSDLPPGTKVANKTGGMPTVRCDAGIVFSPSGPYIVAIMAKHVTDMKSVDSRLAAVSKAAYDHFNTNS